MRWQIGNTVLAFAIALLAGLAYAVQTNDLRDALALKPNYEHGRSLYETCATCHRPDGAGAADGGVPAIAGQHYEVIIKQLVDFRKTRRIDLRMNALAASHRLESPQDLADVAAFISSLPPQRTDDVGNGRFTGVGAQAYSRACANCHGAEAEGSDEDRYPRLAGQNNDYLVNQIDMMIRGSRFNMSWDHSKLLESLTDEEVIGVADYLARLKPVPNSPAN
jgi:cytochrome c553